jgi:hypothetical protein
MAGEEIAIEGERFTSNLTNVSLDWIKGSHCGKF